MRINAFKHLGMAQQKYKNKICKGQSALANTDTCQTTSSVRAETESNQNVILLSAWPPVSDSESGEGEPGPAGASPTERLPLEDRQTAAQPGSPEQLEGKSDDSQIEGVMQRDTVPPLHALTAGSQQTVAHEGMLNGTQQQQQHSVLIKSGIRHTV